VKLRVAALLLLLGLVTACPGPVAAQLGAGRVLTLAVAAGVLVGVRFQPRLIRIPERVRRENTVPAADVL
jgi:hypothetical protein